MRTPKSLNFFLTLVLLLSGLSLFAQNTDTLSYHSSRQLSDTSYSIKKANGDSTIFLFERSSQQSNLNSNLAGIPTYASQDSAVKHGLKEGDIYKLPADANNNHLLAIVDTTTVINAPNKNNFNYTINNTDGSANFYQLRIATYEPSFAATIYWGDGDSTVCVDSASYKPMHSYAQGRSYKVILRINTIEDLTELSINSLAFEQSNPINITNISNIELLTGLNQLELPSINLRTVDTLSIPSSVTYLDVTQNYLTSFNPKTAFNALHVLYLSSNSIASSTELILPSTLITLHLNGMVTVKDGVFMSWDTSDVNTILSYINTLSFNGEEKTLSVVQNNNAIPSGAGATAKSSLESKGWTITTD